MAEKLLKPKPMIVAQTCAVCGQLHVDSHTYRHCALCDNIFCWSGEQQRDNWFGVETHSCGSRRDNSTEADLRRRVEYRCRHCVTRSWIWFGADWPVVRPLALFIFACVAFSVAFWLLVFWGVHLWLQSLGIG